MWFLRDIFPRSNTPEDFVLNLDERNYPKCLEMCRYEYKQRQKASWVDLFYFNDLALF